MDKPRTDVEPPPISGGQRNEWYYVAAGARHGPIPADTIERLLTEKKLQPDTQVWRHGMKDWVSIRDSELDKLVESSPPPVSGDHVGNSLVWIIAFLPLIVGLIDASLASSAEETIARCLAISLGGGADYQGTQVPVPLVFFMNSALCFWDERRVRRAGYSNGWLIAFAMFIVPVYLFVRAKRLKQFPSYALMWVAALVSSVLFVAFVEVARC